MPFVSFLYDLAKGAALYLAIVVGGITLFLILSPIFGYVPYGDRSGPAWVGSFPALGWAAFWNHALRSLTFGAYLCLLMAPAAVFCAGAIRVAERMHASTSLVRVGGGLVTTIVTAFFALGAGWFVALPRPAWLVSIALGLLAGGWLLPR